MNEIDQIKGLNIPRHIAIIMDGNGRWAKEQGKKRTFGHKNGSETLKNMVRFYNKLGVKYVTVYAFSTENWKRAEEEVSFLMTLMRQYLKNSIKDARDDNMRVRIIGRKEGLPKDIQEAVAKLEASSKDYTGIRLQLAINYGGRDEIIRAFNKYLEDPQGPLTEESFSALLDTGDIPDPDLMIRTSGELRTSNFLPWQLAYTEFMFLDKHWPDFSEEDAMESIRYYNRRERRFGGVKDED